MGNGQGNGYAQTPCQALFQMLTNLLNKYPFRYTVHGMHIAYIANLAWSLPYAQDIHMLIHSMGHE